VGIKLAPTLRNIKRKQSISGAQKRKKPSGSGGTRNIKSLDDAVAPSPSPDGPLSGRGGGSGGRGGSNFTVANVGNNGMIYLRYEVSNPLSEPCAVMLRINFTMN